MRQELTTKSLRPCAFVRVLKRGVLKGINLDAEKQQTRIAWGKDEPFLKKSHAWGLTNHLDLPS